MSSLVIVPVARQRRATPLNVTARPPTARLDRIRSSVSSNSTLASSVVGHVDRQRRRSSRAANSVTFEDAGRRVVAVRRRRRPVRRGPVRRHRHVHRIADRHA